MAKTCLQIHQIITLFLNTFSQANLFVSCHHMLVSIAWDALPLYASYGDDHDDADDDDDDDDDDDGDDDNDDGDGGTPTWHDNTGSVSTLPLLSSWFTKSAAKNAYHTVWVGNNVKEMKRTIHNTWPSTTQETH